MKILVLGGGGREHALAWKLKSSLEQPQIFLHPGNAGTHRLGFLPLSESSTNSPQALWEQVRAQRIDFVVIGPEAYLVEGYSDFLRAQGIPVLGPSQAAAQLESSKVYAKEFMHRAGIPTAEYFVAESENDFRQKLAWKLPYVLKFDGLAAGKGVVVATNETEVDSFCERVWRRHEFGTSNTRVVVERCLPGREISYIGLCDGTAFYPFSSSTDFKRVFDGDQGPNTGGMGVVSPSPFFSPALEEKIRTRILAPFLRELNSRKLEYRGALFLGLMISSEGDPFVLEFNTRFGDPETQALLPRLQSDFLALAQATARGTLAECAPPTWDTRHFVYVVGASEGYPGTPVTGDEISGWQQLHPPQELLFFSGVKQKHDALITAGGRVLGAGSFGTTLAEARVAAYAALQKITWRKMHFRRDIGTWDLPDAPKLA